MTTRRLLVRLVELGVTSCSVGERMKVWPECRVPKPLLEELEMQRSNLLDLIGLVGSADTFDGDSVAEPLPDELRRWPARERYAVAVLERDGVPRADAVAAVRG
jgi:hypothetical protein